MARIVYASNGQTIGDGVRVTRVSQGGQVLEVMTDAKTETWSPVKLVAEDPAPAPAAAPDPEPEPDPVPQSWVMQPPAPPNAPEFVTLDGGVHVFADRSDLVVTGTAERVTFERCRRIAADRITVRGTGPETGGNLLAVIDSEDVNVFGCDLADGTNGVYFNNVTRGAILHCSVDRLGHDGMKFMGCRQVRVARNRGQTNPATLPGAHFDNFQMQGPCEEMEFAENFCPTGGQGVFSSAGPHRFIRVHDNVMVLRGHSNAITITGEGIEVWGNTVVRPIGAPSPIARISLTQSGATPNVIYPDNVLTDKASRAGFGPKGLTLQIEDPAKPFHLGAYMPDLPDPCTDPGQAAVTMPGFGADMSLF